MQYQAIQIYSDDKSFLQQAVSILSIDSGHVVSDHPTSEFTAGRAASHPARVVILDLDDGGNLSDKLLHKARDDMAAGTVLIVVSQELSGDHLRDVVRLRSVDWLRKPVDRRQLLDSAITGLQSIERPSTRVSAFISAAGGTGASTAAINAAYVISKNKQRTDSPPTCLLLDLDFASGACGYYLGIDNNYDLGSALENPSRVDTEFVDIIKKEHPDGFHVLSIRAPYFITHVSGEEMVLRLLDVISLKYDRVVVDLPYYETRWTFSILESADDAIIVTDGTIPGLKHARDLYLQLEKRRPKEKISIISNKYNNKLWSRNLSKKEITKVFNGSVVDFLPEDERLMSEASNRGLVPIALNPKAPYSKAIGQLLTRVLG